VSATYSDTEGNATTLSIVDEDELQNASVCRITGGTQRSILSWNRIYRTIGRESGLSGNGCRVEGTLLGLVCGEHIIQNRHDKRNGQWLGYSSIRRSMFHTMKTAMRRQILKDGDGTFHYFEKYIDEYGNDAYESPEGVQWN
jgi:hypothetical protein